MSPEPRVITKDFVLLVIAHVMQALGYASMLLLPLYLAHLGASRTQIGAVMAAGSIGGLAMRPLIGAALDTMGRLDLLNRKRDPADRRNVLVQRTVKGALFVERLADIISKNTSNL